MNAPDSSRESTKRGASGFQSLRVCVDRQKYMLLRLYHKLRYIYALDKKV